MIKNLLVGLAVVASALTFAPEAKADEYGYGSNYYTICNETVDSYVTYETDVTYGTLDLYVGECDTIWTDDSYIVVDYDDSWAPGNQWDTVYLYYPDDLSFKTWSYDAYGEVIGTFTW